MPDQATHHGPWCDDPPEAPCEACRRRDQELPSGREGVSVGIDQGLWLLARLAVHSWYNQSLAKNRQEPLPGLQARFADRMEVARITLELAVAKTTHLPKEFR